MFENPSIFLTWKWRTFGKEFDFVSSKICCSFRLAVTVLNEDYIFFLAKSNEYFSFAMIEELSNSLIKERKVPTLIDSIEITKNSRLILCAESVLYTVLFSQFK